jgi:hypothetical protein
MSLASASRGHAAMVTVLSVVLVASSAKAQASGRPDTAITAASGTAAGPLAVWVDAPAQAFDKARLQASLSHELGREVVLTDEASAAAVQIRLDDAAHAEVGYTTPSGEKLSRRVDLPSDRERAVQVVSWLTVNLVRDEASELLDELRARRKQEADARAVQQAAAEKLAAQQAAAEKLAADKAAADKAREAAEKAGQDRAATGARDDLLRDPWRSIDAAIVTPLSFLRDSPKRELHLQLALAFGRSGAIDGFGLSPGVLQLRRDLLGVTLGAAAVFVGGNARGIIVGGGYSQLDGTLQGLQFGGGAAVQRGAYARGAVVAAGGALAGDVDGAVVGGGFATATVLHGLGLSGGLTLIRGRSEGVLIGGAATSSVYHRGISVAGGVNAARDLEGLALAPVNVHRRVKGVQFGLVNVAEQVDGAAIGLLSFSKSGRVQPVLWGANDGSLHVGVKSIAGYAFTQLGAGLDVGRARFIYEAGVGAHWRVGPSFFFEPGVHYSVTNNANESGTSNANETSGSPDQHQLHYLVQVGLRVGSKLDLLAAAGARHIVAGGSGAPFAPEVQAGIAFF